MERLSVTILTRNEEKNIGRCLDALQGVADEIVVVDAFSNDRTVEICERYGCKVTSREFMGFGSQRQYAAGLTSNSYVLSLDADEVIDDTLREGLLKCKREGFGHRVYKIVVTNYFCGKPVSHSGLEPASRIRLFNKRYAMWSLDSAGDAVKFGDGLQAAQLPGAIHHYRCSSLEEFEKKENRLAALKADMLAEKYDEISLLKPHMMALRTFLRCHVVDKALLDGNHGLIIARRRAGTELQAYKMARTLLKERRAAKKTLMS